MQTQLKIQFEGTAPGLAEHVLSVSAFGNPLYRLLRALQRIASGMVKDAVGEAYGARGGRFTAQAKYLDLELVRIEGASPTGYIMNIVQRTPPAECPPLPLNSDITDRIGYRFIDAVERERRNVPDNAMVRKFLRSIPQDVAVQRYTVLDAAGGTRSVEVREAHLPEMQADLPFLLEITGSVVGVGFEPGRNEVRLKPAATAQINCSATPEQVNLAISLRSSAVRALIVHGNSNRLLRLSGDSEAPPEPESDDVLFARWHDLLRVLAQ